MSKHIDLLFMSPPSVDFPQFVEAQDSEGERVDVGEWIAPDDVSPFWRFRVTPAELLQMLIMEGKKDAGAQGTQGTRGESLAPAIRPSTQRSAIKSKLASAKSRSAKPAPAPPEAANSTWPVCKSCDRPYDPNLDLYPCAACGDDFCRRCVPTSGAICPACDALAGDPDDGGFDPSVGPGGGTAPDSSRLFDDTFHGKAGDSKNDDDED